MDLHSAVMIGHSMGSAIALSLALDHPRRVLGLGLTGAGARLRVSPELLEQTSNPTTFANAIATVISRSFSARASARLIELATRRMAETRSSVLYGDFLACDEFDERNRLVELHQPTLVLCGTDDQMTPVRLCPVPGQWHPERHAKNYSERRSYGHAGTAAASRCRHQ